MKNRLSPNYLVDILIEEGVEFFAGVPDSLLRDFCACLEDRIPKDRHVIAANEGSALAMGIGYHIGTGRVPLVYLQNSGLGNIVNPLLSLADPSVYSVPMLLMIGWRGETRADASQKPDEPQHIKQGALTRDLLELMGIAHEIVSPGVEDVASLVSRLISRSISQSGPVAMLFRKGVFENNDKPSGGVDGKISRESAIKTIVDNLPSDVLVVSTTGMASRELYEHRKWTQSAGERDFLTVGGMGHASQVALGIAISNANTPVCCLDGDGAFLMHMGAVPYLATRKNIIYILLNNQCHDSVGGQPTIINRIDVRKLASAIGFQSVVSVSTETRLLQAVRDIDRNRESTFIEVICSAGHRANLGRPQESPIDNKNKLMKSLGTHGKIASLSKKLIKKTS